MVKVALDKLESAAAASVQETKKPAPRKSGTGWLLKLILLMIMLVIAAPSLITVSGQAPALLSKIHPKLAQAVSFRTLKMHWWTPVELTQLKVRDLSQVDDDKPITEAPLLCEIERASTVEPLWRIAMNGGRGTGILIKSPQLTLIADEQGTNVERTVSALLGEAGSDATAPAFPFRITIEDGSVQLQSSFAAAAPLQDAAADADPNAASESADSDKDDRVESSAVSRSASVSASVTSINAFYSTMDTERWLPEMMLTAEIKQSISSPAVVRTALRPTRLAAGLDDVVSDFPNVPLEDLTGANEAGDSAGPRFKIHLKPRADEKGRQTIQLGARDVDLRLVQPFLSMLGLDVSCDGMISCGIDARMAGATLNEGLVGRLKLLGDNVRIRQRSWARNEWLPMGKVDASGAVAIAEDGILIEDLRIQSDVAQVIGSGELRHRPTTAGESKEESRQKVELKGTVDLAHLTSSLRETLAIHKDVTIQRGRLTFGLRGSVGSGHDAAAHTPPATSDAAATAVVNHASLLKSSEVTADVAAASTSSSQSNNGSAISVQTVSLPMPAPAQGTWQMVIRTEEFEAVRGGRPLSVDPTLRLDAAGPFLNGLPELAKARVTAEFGTIDCIPDKSAWKVSGLIQPTALWEQLQQFADVPQPGLRGDVSFQSRIAMKQDTIQLTDLQLSSADVKASSAALDIHPSNPLTSMLDGTMHVEGSGAALRTLMSPWLDASWLAAQSQVVGDLTASPKREIQLRVRMAPAGVANIQRPGVLPVSHPQNRLTTAARTAASDSSFVIDEGNLDLTMVAKNGGQQFEIQKGSVTLPGITALITGTVNVPEGDMIVDLAADTTYDLDMLSRRLLAADSGLLFSGKGRDTFTLKGAPSALYGTPTGSAGPKGQAPASLKGSGTIQWTSARAWGLLAGPASMETTLDNGLLRCSPIQCSLNGGEMSLMPQYDLANSRLQLGTGSRLRNLQVTPELCREWLGYVAPMLADTAQVQGDISARVERFLWDFNAPQNSDVLGQLTIHQAQAAAGSSLATILQVIDLLRKSGEGSQSLADRTLVLPEQTVPVQIRQGFVAHKGLIMELSGYRLETSGAVGLNKQLQMTIDVPLEKSTATTSGRSVKIPLRGTISQPQPDTGALLQNLGAQKIQEKIEDQVDRNLNKQLNKLFEKF